MNTDIVTNKKNKPQKNTNTKYTKQNTKHQLINQGSLSSAFSLIESKEKFIFDKKVPLSYKTQYSKLTKKKNNTRNKSESQLNLNSNKNSQRSGRDTGRDSVDRYNTRNNLASHSGVNNSEEAVENHENKDVKNSVNKKKKFFEERDNQVGTFLDIITNRKNTNKFNINITNIKINKDSNNINFDNGKFIENGMSSGKFRKHTPINGYPFEGNDNITIYSRKQKTNLNSDIRIKETKKNLDINPNPQDIKKLRKDLKKEILSKIKEKKKDKREKKKIAKLFIVPYERKQYDEKELNELEYGEAIIYDKRSFGKMLWFILKERHTLINTFCSQSNLKPFSTKLLVLIFSLTCYFVINGFLYNEEYVSQKMESKGKSFYEYMSDSIERILYTSIVGGAISFIIGILFNTEKKIDIAKNKYNNNIILLKGEIAKIHRTSKIILLCFIIIQFILMAAFTIYIFCFCYVYPNNQLDWFESSLLVIGIIQLFSFCTCILLAFMKFMGIKLHLEFCFKITSYFEDNK